MIDYEEMSDFEINKLVAERINSLNFDGSEFQQFFASALIAELEIGVFNPCNNPDSAWPIILENKISLMNDGDVWEASIDFDGDLHEHGTDEVLTKYAEHKNPLRAAMTVFLMMKREDLEK